MASDTTPPTVASVAPLSGATSVLPNANVTVRFSEPMATATITAGTFELRDPSGTQVAATVSYDAATQTATLDPVSPLDASSGFYTALVRSGPTGVKDLAGNPLATDFAWSFTTAVPPMTVLGSPTVDANGVKYYSVVSAYLGAQPTTLRILEPTNPAPGEPHRFLYVLPVDAGVTNLSSQFGDGLEQARLLNLQNLYNLTLVAPSFPIIPWYGDNDSNPDRRLESFLVKHVVPFVDQLDAAGPDPERWLVGFSKSGFGALTLIFRHPDVFDAAAAWDAPAELTSFQWAEMPDTFGTEANLVQYEIPGLVANNYAPFLTRNRIWISGDVAVFTADMATLDQQMTSAGVLHTFVGGVVRDHSWSSGWLQIAIGDLDSVDLTGGGASDTTPPTVASVAPLSGATSVLPNANVTVRFSEPMATATITAGTFELRDPSGTQVAATVSYDAATQTATLHPVSPLDASSGFYTALVRGGPTGVKDLAGNPLATDFAWSFTTAVPPMTVLGSPTVDANGVKYYSVVSAYLGAQPTTLRILEPTNPAPGEPHRFLYVLPVDAGVTNLSSQFGDGLEQARLLNLQNLYNLTLVAPSFPIIPWYGDNDSNPDRRLESFLVKHVVPFVDQLDAAGPDPERWLVGFSKSGFGR